MESVLINTVIFCLKTGMAQNPYQFCYHEPDMCRAGINLPLLSFRVRMRVSTEYCQQAAVCIPDIPIMLFLRF